MAQTTYQVSRGNFRPSKIDITFHHRTRNTGYFHILHETYSFQKSDQFTDYGIYLTDPKFMKKHLAK